MTAYDASAIRLLLAERSSGASLAAIAAGLGAEQTVLLVVGPEGGWDKDELRLAQEQGCQAITMGNVSFERKRRHSPPLACYSRGSANWDSAYLPT